MNKEQIKDITGLYLNWLTLEQKILNNGEFDLPLFAETFSQTHKYLRNCICKQVIDRDLMVLFSGAFAFCKTHITGISANHDAAVLITEAFIMKTVCGHSVAEVPNDKGSVFFSNDILNSVTVNVDYTDILDAVAKVAGKLD